MSPRRQAPLRASAVALDRARCCGPARRSGAQLHRAARGQPSWSISLDRARRGGSLPRLCSAARYRSAKSPTLMSTLRSMVFGSSPLTILQNVPGSSRAQRARALAPCSFHASRRSSRKASPSLLREPFGLPPIKLKRTRLTCGLGPLPGPPGGVDRAASSAQHTLHDAGADAELATYLQYAHAALA